MATREEVKAVICYMKGAFPNFHPELDGEINAVDVLLDQLGDMDTASLRMAVRAACSELEDGKGRKFAPSASEIRAAFTALKARAAGMPTATEAWGAIMDSFRHPRTGPSALLDHPIVEDAIRCMGGLHKIGMSEDNMADRAHFLRMFEQLRTKAMQETAEIPAITEYVEATRRALTSGERVPILDMGDDR